MAAEKTIKIKLDGDAKGVAAAAKEAKRHLEGLSDHVKKQASVFKSAGDKAGETFGLGLVTGAVDSLASKLPAALSNPYVAGAAAVAGVALSSVLGGALAAGVIGGSGLIGVVGGLKIAAKHPEVKAAADDLKAIVSSSLTNAAKPFVPAAKAAITTVRKEFRHAQGDIRTLFSSTARYVEPLVSGASKGFSSILSGITALSVVAGPVMRVLGKGFEEIGHIANKGMGLLSDNSVAAASALQQVINVVEIGIASFFGMVNALVEVYEWVDKLGAKIRGDEATLLRYIEMQDSGAGAASAMATGVRALVGDIDGVTVSAIAAEGALRAYNLAMQKAAGEATTVEQANINFQESLDRATEAAEKNGAGIDANVPKQRANRQSLIDLRNSTFDLYNATLEQTGSQEAANAVMARGRTDFLATAKSMGVGSKEAQTLANKLFGIPKETKPKVTADVKGANAAVDGFGAKADHATRPRTVRIGVSIGNAAALGAISAVTSSGMGRRAAGGPVAAGRSYLVGERGPEVVSFGQSGYVTPNHKLGSNDKMTLDVRSSGAPFYQSVVEINRRESRARAIDSRFGGR